MKVHTILAGELYLRGHTLGVKNGADLREMLRTINCGYVVALAGPADPRVYDWSLKGNTPIGDGRAYLHAPIPDGKKVTLRPLNKALAVSLATIERGQSVLVHCHAGRNRSALLAALIVRERLGITGAEAVAYLRSRRPNALANEAFVKYLNGLEAP